MGSFGTKTQQAVASWLSLLIARSCMHDIYMCVVASAEDLEARALTSSAQTKAPANTLRARAHPTQDGRRGLQRQRERDGGCRASLLRRKKRRVFIISSKAIFKKSFHGLTTCVSLLFCCMYQYRRYCQRPP